MSINTIAKPRVSTARRVILRHVATDARAADMVPAGIPFRASVLIFAPVAVVIDCAAKHVHAAVGARAIHASVGILAPVAVVIHVHAAVGVSAIRASAPTMTGRISLKTTVLVFVYVRQLVWLNEVFIGCIVDV